MRARLVCRVRPGTTQSFDVAGEAVLGREPGSGMALPLEGVSRLHARVLGDGKAFWLEDLKSTNGTFLNGEPLHEREKLRNLDVISLGRKVDVLFLLREGEAAASRRELGIVRAALQREGADSIPYEVPMGEARLGRSPACNLQLEASSVSKFHARVERSVERLLLTDEGSANGTFVNGTRIEQPVELRNGDVVSLGGSELLRVTIETGEVTSTAGVAAVAAGPAHEVPQWNADWRTRLEWSTSEMAAMQELRKEEPATLLRKSRAEPATLMRKPGEGPTVTRRPEAPAPPVVAAKPAAPPVPAVPRAPAAPPLAAAPPAPVAAAPPPPAAPPERAPVVRPTAPPARVAPPAAGADQGNDVATRPQPQPAARPPAPAPARVVALRLQAPGLDVTLREAGSWDIGRSREAGIRIDHPTVSRRHARLVVSAALSASVEDLGAANGTFVADVRLAPGVSQALGDGELLRLGDVRIAVTQVRE